MNKRYVIYDETGAIRHAGSCPDRDFDRQLDAHEGLFITEGYASPTDHYVSDGKILEKAELDVSAEVSGLTVSLPNLPAGTQIVVVRRASVIADKDGVEIEFDAPGSYWVLIRPASQYRDHNLEVTVG
ncbi:hypothetical protein ACLUEY_01370 [Vreelandella aquamarina]